MSFFVIAISAFPEGSFTSLQTACGVRAIFVVGCDLLTHLGAKVKLAVPPYSVGTRSMSEF